MNTITVGHFALDSPVASDEYVTRAGKIFACGSYPDKQFDLTEQEADVAIAAFSPVELDLEHAPSLLDSKLGTLNRVWRQGNDLYGETQLPVWLDKALEGTDRTVSCTWDRDTKMLQKLALVRSPRVTDAVLMSQYADFAARHDTPHGQMALQDIHDMAARNGAVCSKDNAAKMASTHEASALQQVHDKATQHGAVCQAVTQPPNGGNPWSPVSLFSAVKDGSMTIKDFFMGMKEAGIIEDEATPLPPIAAPVVPVQQPTMPVAQPAPTFSADLAAIKAEKEAQEATFKAEKEAQTAEFAAIKAENARLKAERIQKDADAEAEKLILAHKADPVERESIVAAFTQVATDDTVYGVVTFSAADGTEAKTTRVDQLKAIFAARTAHERNVELVPDHDGKEGAAFTIKNPQTTPQAGQEKPLTEAEAQRLIGMMTKHGRPVAATFNSAS